MDKLLALGLELAEFGLQAVVILACLMVLIGFVASLASKSKDDSEVKITDLNKKWTKNQNSLLQKKLSKKDYKTFCKGQKKQSKENTDRPCVYVLSFEGDIKAAATEQLREEISTVLAVAQKGDQVVLQLESPGGMVHGYGLAASQLARIRKAELPLTICVDKIAASGGYMMACLADKILAAPFAIIGSIGVVASLPNFNKVLKNYDVDYLEITAGEYKRTITPLGEITEAGMTKFKEQIQQVHDLFKKHVIGARKDLDLNLVATGEYWYGQQALDLKLVDELGTSDDLLMSLSKDHHLLSVKFTGKKTWKDKLNENLSAQVETLYNKLGDLNWKNQFQ